MNDAKPPDAAISGPFSLRAADDGSFRFRVIEAGTYTVEAWGAFAMERLATANANAGDTNVEIVAPQACAISLAVRVSGAKVTGSVGTVVRLSDPFAASDLGATTAGTNIELGRPPLWFAMMPHRIEVVVGDPRFEKWSAGPLELVRSERRAFDIELVRPANGAPPIHVAMRRPAPDGLAVVGISPARKWAHARTWHAEETAAGGDEFTDVQTGDARGDSDVVLVDLLTGRSVVLPVAADGRAGPGGDVAFPASGGLNAVIPELGGQIARVRIDPLSGAAEPAYLTRWEPEHDWRRAESFVVRGKGTQFTAYGLPPGAYRVTFENAKPAPRVVEVEVVAGRITTVPAN
jgi:hypothetical protein